MDATTLIAKAQSLGVTLTVRDGMIHPSGATSPEARALLVQMIPFKQAIIEELTWPRNGALEAELTPDPATGDLSSFVGAIVSADTLAVLQGRATALGWTLHARPSGAKWYIGGLEAQREFGKIIAGAAPEEGHYHYVIKPGTPLHNPALDFDAYKKWLWPKMQNDTGDASVLAELYAIVNGAWVGCDVYVDGPNADAVLAAAGWLMNQYTHKRLPIFAAPDKKKVKS